MSHGIRHLLRFGRNTTDLERALAFYRDALGFQVDDAACRPPAWMGLPGVDIAPTRCARLSLGAQQIELTEFPRAAPYPLDTTSCDLAFQHCAIVVDDIDAACAQVLQHGALPITQDGPQRLPPATGSVSAFKFRDPDGHPLELIHFPPGSGDPAWQTSRTNQGALGLDHSAISVADVERSIRFYALLGLQVAARGVNHGVAQQRLDALGEVEVDVVALQAHDARTPHLELLGYRQPCGRPALPLQASATAADRLVWRVDAIEVLLDAITDADFPDALIASGRVLANDAALLRDPDGHLHVLMQIND